MDTIAANVNTRLLSKADRLFTGTLAGRITEILQNARRAGATHVTITHHNNKVIVKDNGRGIDDFSQLLDLGGSGWPEGNLEASEDPAGVGIFCLASGGRKLNVRSQGKQITIDGDGWTGALVPVVTCNEAIQGTELEFEDEPWTSNVVDPLAVFSGMNVTVDGQSAPCEPFVRNRAAHHPNLGVRIEVRTLDRLSPWHQQAARVGCFGHNNVVVNFHGQTVGFDYRPISESNLYYLVDMTDEPTGIRLMLPARTQLVENEAYEQLKQMLEREGFLHVQRRGNHRLPYEEYQRARELGIDLPESEPVFQVGLLHSDPPPPEPVNVIMPKDMTLAACYRPAESLTDAEHANIHLLAAVGATHEPFVPVDISPNYRQYGWAQIATIDRVALHVGKTRHEDWVGSGQLTCVDRLSITAHTSDGKQFHSDVCMAVPEPKEDEWDDRLLVTEDVRYQLASEQVWHHLGGYNDEGDTYDTQAYDFSRELDAFWLALDGPDETLRAKIMAAMIGIGDAWRSVTVLSNGYVTLHFDNGQDKTLLPPKRDGGER